MRQLKLYSKRGYFIKSQLGKTITLYSIISLLAIVTFFPFAFAIITSLKSRFQFLHFFWQPTLPLHLENYVVAWIALNNYLLNSAWYTTVAVISIVFTSSLSSYILARYDFPGREIIFYAIISLLMVPFVLTLVATFMIVKDLHLINTPWGVILPWTSRSQAFCILILRSFFARVPQEMFESAYVDGASDFRIYWSIALPLCRGSLIVITIIHILACWNDYIWPLVVLAEDSLRPVSVGLCYFSNAPYVEYGQLMAGYLIASLPLLIVFTLFLKQFVGGLGQGAIKI